MHTHTINAYTKYISKTKGQVSSLPHAQGFFFLKYLLYGYNFAVKHVADTEDEGYLILGRY